MAFSSMTREDFIAIHIRNILKETMGEDYMTQIAKRKMLCKEDKLVNSLQRIEDIIQVKIFTDTEK